MKDNMPKNKTSISNPTTPISNNNNNDNNLNNDKDNNKDNNINNSNEVKNVINNIKSDSYKSEEEILFMNKIKKYKILFLKGDYKELKD